MDNNYSIKRLLVIIIMLVIVIGGGTFAWFTYQSKESALVLTIGEIDDTQIVLKPYQVTGTMTPVTTYTDGVYSTVEVSNNGNSSSSINLFYKINELDEELIDNGLMYTIVSSSTPNGTYTEVKTGDFTSFKGQSEALIYETEVNDKMYYKVYLWVKTLEQDQSVIQGTTLDVELNGSILQKVASPEIVEGMIPVTISNTGVVTTISQDDENWYDYGHKQWANIVLVKSGVRSTYEGTTGVTVTQSDILAYYVWIPRFKYKLWTTDASETTSPQTINIIFEDKDAPMLLEKTKGLYRTHPAFWWDGNNDGKVDEGETLAGIWVGKFETTGDATTPTILPNTSSLTNQNVSTQFTTSLKFSNGSFDGTTGSVIFSDASNGVSLTGTTYGLGINADSHMMKNSEWGAAAYLSHSQYGINSEVRINNNSNFTTGCGASEANGSGTTSCQNAYAGVSSGTYPQSTTGNTTGIFDMSGGAWEYVMGNYGNVAGGSGFTTFPESKYYNLYLSSQFTGDYSTNMALCTLETCGGHALNETSGWYGDYSGFIHSGGQWYVRGGSATTTSRAGVFGASDLDGGSNVSFSWRSVIITLPKYSVSYNMNGGSNGPSNQTKVYGVDMTLSSTEPTKENVTFNGWATSSDSRKVVYQPGDIYTNNVDQNLYAIWTDSVAPVGGLILTNNVAASQTATLTCTDNDGVTAYYFGTNQAPSDSDFTSITSTTNMNVTKTVSDSGVYYLYCIDSDRNLSDMVNTETYKTTITYTTTSSTTSTILTEKGKSFTYSPALTNYTFLGWYESSDFSGSKITTYTPSGNITLYGKTIQNTLSGDVSISGTVTYGETLTANPNIVADESTQNAGEEASYTYQWYTNTTNSTSGGTAISGATSKTYTIAAGLIDKYIYVVVTASKSNYNDLTVSAITNTTVTKQGNPISVTALGGTYSGTALNLVTTSGAQGTVYYSTSMSLTSSNYSSSGSTTIPTGTCTSTSGNTYTVYYYTPGTGNYDSKSGTISDIRVTCQTYTVNYNANGGSGTPSVQTKYYGITLTLSSTVPTKSGYTFLGWSTDSSATSATYSSGGSYTANAAATLYAVWKSSNVTITFNANGGELATSFTTVGQSTYAVPLTGNYKLEVWGAQGGTGMYDGSSKNAGGYGGYSVGTISLNAGSTLYVNVGGQGTNAIDRQAGGAGGNNGGGAGGNDTNYSSSGGNEPGGGGGGATHIATASGLLSSLSSNTASILIVAGGGGGGAYYSVGGHGGGYQGNKGNSSATIATQSSGYSFGQGGPGNNYSAGGGGGGGGYYGGGGGPGDGTSGSGGSGYIGNSSLTIKTMYCYSCTTSSAASTKTVSTTNVSSTPTANYAKSGASAARITILSNASKTVTNGSTYGELLTPTRTGYSFKGWNTKSDGTGTTITSSSTVNLSGDTILYAIWGKNPAVGDYISYTPTKTSYTTSTGSTGYSSTQTINPSELKLWRILKINSDGSMDIISHYVSSTAVYFHGDTGYNNYIGYLNVLASQYQTSGITTKSRHFGYSNQTEYNGGGDTGYTTDYNLVNSVLGTRVAYGVNATSTAKAYWMASRYGNDEWSENYQSANARLVRYIKTNGDTANIGFYQYYCYYGQCSWEYWSNAYPIRPIVTLKAGLQYTGSGTSSSPLRIVS